MAKYRKKPVIIEAVQFKPQGDVRDFMGFPILVDENKEIYIEIPTLEGIMRADWGDWIITGVKGEKYPCKPDIFEATYEPAEGEVSVKEG